MPNILVTEAARQHSTSRRTVLRMIARGELETVDKLGWERTGPYVLDSDHVDAVFAAKAAAKAAAATSQAPAA